MGYLKAFDVDLFLSRNPGAQIIYDVKCSRWVAESIRFQGGRPVMWNTGHALVKAKLKETGAALAQSPSAALGAAAGGAAETLAGPD